MKITLENNGISHTVDIPIENADAEQIVKCFEDLVIKAGVDMDIVKKEIQLWAEEIESEKI